MMDLIIRPEAEADPAATTNYCARGGVFAAQRFLQRVEDRLKFLAENPEGAPVAYAHFRRLLLHPYPFGLFYHLTNDRIFVIAVLDLRRNPKAITQRLDSDRN